jgi:adenine-specific DNA-methyltransferase
MPRKPTSQKSVEALKHDEAKRRNIPTAEHQSVMDKAQQALKLVRYPRNTDLDPQLVWRGKDEQDWSDLVAHAPPLYIQEKVHPKALIDDLTRMSKQAAHEAGQLTADLFADFNGMPKGVDKTEFYQHEQNWSNRMILGDSLQVMASLAEREGLRGKVQCIYFDPPYGIKFNSNFQWSTTSRDVKDGNAAHITREPEQVKAFRDTWRGGIHSYLTYLRDRLTVARDLLTESGSIFVQIGDENVHRVRAVMDEVFGGDNCCCLFTVQKTGGLSQSLVPATSDYLLWYCRDMSAVKFRPLYFAKTRETVAGYNFIEMSDGSRWSIKSAEAAGLKIDNGKIYQPTSVESANPRYEFRFEGKTYNHRWKTHPEGLRRLANAARFHKTTSSLRYVRYIEDFPVVPLTSVWTDTGSGSFLEEQVYVVQTVTKVVQRCVLLTTDPGDLVLDPTCGSGTTATVAEQWGRRWITIDTSRVALALARARIMGARYPSYVLADSPDGQLKEAEVTRTAPSTKPTYGSVRHGFIYERIPHVTLKAIANNSEIDVIWERWQRNLEPLRERLNAAVKKSWHEWEIPREPDAKWRTAATKLHADWWATRVARQQEIDKSIASKAEFEYLYDRPYEDKRKVRVPGPFTVESLSPHRMLGVDENDELIDPNKVSDKAAGTPFDQMILENLKAAGVQQAHKEDRVSFTSLTGWPGKYICAEGRYLEGDSEKRAGVFIGPEFGTVSRPDLVEAAREAGDGGFDVLIACAFNYEAHANEFSKLGRMPVLKARMNADLHMAADLKTTGTGNLFVIFGEPDITVAGAGDRQIQVKVNGVDVFDPSSGEVRSDGADGIACWFIDTDYNGESFFVRHAYFLGQSDPYKALRSTLKAEINEEAWETLHSDTSRPFDKPKSGRIAVKVINHLGDEVMKVFRV